MMANVKTTISKLGLGTFFLLLTNTFINISLAGSVESSLNLGMPTQLMVQPYVTVDVCKETSPGEYTSLGPSSEITYFDFAGISIPIGAGRNSFLLDTGANSILIADTAAQDIIDAENAIAGNSYTSEGTFAEMGVNGTAYYDISPSYRVAFTGSDATVHYLNGTENQGIHVLLGPQTELGASIEEGGVPGIIGMPAMTGSVVTLSMNEDTGYTPPGGDILEWDAMDLALFLAGGGLAMETTFSDDLAAGTETRYTIPLDNRLTFSAEDGLPEGTPAGATVPEYADVPFLTAKTTKVGADDVYREREGTFLLDTGAQFSMISRRTAFALGLDENGDGTFDQEKYGDITIAGVGDSDGRDVPVLCIDELRLPTNEGVDVVWNDPSAPNERLGIQVLVLDLVYCGDVNYDGMVDQDDVDILQENIDNNTGNCTYDINGDNKVDDDDLAIVLEQKEQNEGGAIEFIDGVFGIDMLTAGNMLTGDISDYDDILDLDFDDLALTGTPFFDQVHCDFRNWENGAGTLILDVAAEHHILTSVPEPTIWALLISLGLFGLYRVSRR